MSISYAKELAMGNLRFWTKNAVREMNRVYYLVRNNTLVNERQGYNKFFILGIYREMMKDYGFTQFINCLTPALIIAGIQTFGSQNPSMEKDELFTLILAKAEAYGFAITRHDLDRCFTAMVKRPQYFQECLVDDPAIADLYPIKQALYRKGNLPDLIRGVSASPMKFPQFLGVISSRGGSGIRI